MKSGWGIAALRRQRGTRVGLGLGALALLLQMLIWAGATPVLAQIGGITQWICTPAGLEPLHAQATDQSGGAAAQALKCPLCPLLAALAGPPPAPGLPLLLPPFGQADVPPVIAQRTTGRIIAAAQARAPPIAVKPV